MKISQKFNMQGNTPFIDVDLDTDTKLYVDPHRIRLLSSQSRYASDAVQHLDSFLSCITKFVLNDDMRGRKLLEQCNEPYETHLGVSKSGIRGKGTSIGKGHLIWKALTTDLRPLVRVGILKHLEDLPLFVPNVAYDGTSDITTRIIFTTLLDFTEDICQRFPDLLAVCAPAEFKVWDSNILDWSKQVRQVPLINGSPLVLVPRDWAGKSMSMSAQGFHQIAVLGWAQEQSLRRSPGSKARDFPKYKLAKLPKFKSGRDTNTRIALQAFEDEEWNLLKNYIDYVNNKFPHGETTGI